MKKINLVEWLFRTYMLLLIINIVNKSFVPFGIELRYIVSFIGIITCIFYVKQQNYKIYIMKSKNNILILLMYVLIIVSFFNAYYLKNMGISSDYKQLIILNLYNLLNIGLLIIMQKKITYKLVYKALKIALFILSISILITFFGYTLPYCDYTSITADNAIFGNARIAGYGVDPNYVTFIYSAMIIIIITYEKKKAYKVTSCMLCMIFILLAVSKTVILLDILSIFIYIFIRNNKNIIRFILPIIMLLTPFAILIVQPLKNLNTLSIRYTLWENALNHWLNHPIFGNGLSSVRIFKFIESGWYVQCHSTFFQMLCEQGIIIVILYILFFVNNIKKYSNTPFCMIFFIYYFWSLTYETMYLSYTILLFGIFANIKSKKLEVGD